MKRFTQTVIFLRDDDGRGVVLLFLFALFSVISNCHADQTVFYDEVNYGGSTFTLTATGGCYNLKSKWVGRVSSAQVQPGSCMIAWKNENCNGQSVKLLPNSSDTMDLRNMDFNKKIKSVSLCTEISFRPALEVGNRMWNPTRGRIDSSEGENTGLHFGAIRERVELNFYDEPNHRGSILTVTSNGDCYTFKTRWMNRASSLDSGGRCINMWDAADCQGVPATLCAGDDENARNLKLIGYDKSIKSVRLCTPPLKDVINNDNNEKQVSGSGGKEDSADTFKSRNNARKNEEDSFEMPELDTAAEDDVRKAALFEHNLLRRLHGVPDLKWDLKLQHMAQSHADWLVRNNKFEHSTNDDYGENIAGISTSGKIEATKQAIQLWYNEIQHYNFENPGHSVLGIKAGHFTQIVWKSTTHIGLGIGFDSTRQWYVVVCNYAPPGNYKGLYEKNVLPPVQK